MNNEDALNELNCRGKTTSISCFDISTLYTKIPHDKLLKVLNELIYFCFRQGNEECISADDHGAKSANGRRSEFLILAKSDLKKVTFATLNSVMGYSDKLLEFQ